ncbi:hypothetical protein EVU97_00210 [Dermacoccus sp. 147Ba]|uniref:hypothetical protein n=1 Tax=Dermacoccus sp. 147Ba TaxID=2510111 RepID=UPI00101D16DA|nr:hypothetical protein [Dermacoccus sp. 147Ba]RYI24195.1 hypothetical protein EVU97_00210 [Dermacoccus sp. 147Ba]
MAMWEATQEHEASFTEEFGRDLLVLAAGMGVAATLGAVAVWVVEPVGLLTGWNRSAALWSLVPALALLAAHWQVAKSWTGGARVAGFDSRATILAALMLAPAVLLLSGALVAALVGLVGGPRHTNLVADDLTTGAHLLRAGVGVVIGVGVALAARRLTHRR